LLTYLAAKSFVLLSHFENNLKYIAIDAIFRKIAKTAFEKAFEKDTRVLKEVMRYFLNLYIHGKKYYLQDGCILQKKSIREYLKHLCNIISHGL